MGLYISLAVRIASLSIRPEEPEELLAGLKQKPDKHKFGASCFIETETLPKLLLLEKRSFGRNESLNSGENVNASVEIINALSLDSDRAGL